jgi:AcrR family transcriptional regulator
VLYFLRQLSRLCREPEKKGFTMTVTPLARRAPMQERSRQTVIRILDAAAAIADEHGVDAASTRAIADRAGVSYPSLYRFFADREAIHDELMERHCAELDARCLEAEQTWTCTSTITGATPARHGCGWAGVPPRPSPSTSAPGW